MHITEAQTKPDRSPIVSLSFKAVAVYPGKTLASGDTITKVLVDTPQESPNAYITFFQPQPPMITAGQEYEVKAQITGAGAKGITVSHFNGKVGVNVNKEATLAPLGQQPAVQAAPVAAAPQQQYQPPVEDPAFVHPTVAEAQPVAAGVGVQENCKMSRAELLSEQLAIFTEASQLSQGLGPEASLAFATAAMSTVPLYWFGDKTVR